MSHYLERDSSPLNVSEWLRQESMHLAVMGTTSLPSLSPLQKHGVAVAISERIYSGIPLSDGEYLILQQLLSDQAVPSTDRSKGLIVRSILTLIEPSDATEIGSGI